MLSLSDIVNVKVGIGKGVFEAPGTTVIGGKKPSSNLEILKLFANGEQGFFYDPNDLTTMWQDQAKLLPITGEGQPVWHILDKSGNNNHAFATSSATRPILRQNATTGAYYLEFDGSDDFLVTNPIDFTAKDEVSLFAGVRKLSDAARGVILELSNTVSNNGAFSLEGSTNSVDSYTAQSKGSVVLLSAINQPELKAPNNAVLTVKSSISTDYLLLKANKHQNIANLNQGEGNYGNYPLYIGRRGGTSFPFNGHIYSLIGIGRLTTDAETIALEKLIAKNTGVTLNV